MATTPERQINRKTFFKEAPRAFLRAFAEGAAPERQAADGEPVPRLRPPGAAPEAEFLELCCGVAACAEACPADAIQIRPIEGEPDRAAPLIVPAEAACILCDELDCMSACPSGALTPVPRGEVRIGLARVDAGRCLSWAGIDPGCNYCADRCPAGREAIRIDKNDAGHGPVVESACTGCGVCEYYCPASPAAIRVFEIAQ
jgi:MauM/NapG family ferredoxin protein